MFKNVLKYNVLFLLMSLLIACSSTKSDASSVSKNIQSKGLLFPKVVSNQFLASAKVDEKLFLLMHSTEGTLHIMPADDPSISKTNLARENHQAIISEPLSKDLSVIYVLDSGDFSSVISSAHMAEFGLSLDDIKKLAMDNINKYAASEKNSEMKVANLGITAYRHDGKYESSLLLADKFIKGLEKKVSGELVVFIPVSNAFFYIDGSHENAKYEAKGFAKGLTKQLPNALVKQGLERKNGKWTQQ